MVAGKRGADGVITVPTDKGKAAIATILEREGHNSALRKQAIRAFDQAQENEPLELVPGLHVVKWSVDSLRLSLEAEPMRDVVPLKIAFEYLMLHLGSGAYTMQSTLDHVRAVLRDECSVNNETVTIERLEASTEPRAFHGITFEGKSEAQVQIRLFGKVAFRIRFIGVETPRKRWCYTHDLVTNAERLTRLHLEL